jgi:diketogulonate reductase-like aldo/keto reductase
MGLVSGVKHLKELGGPTPTINQIELHPWCQQREIVEYCKSNDIIVQAYCPLVKAKPEYFNNEVIVQVAKKHGKDSAQVLVRWSLQKGWVMVERDAISPLPKSISPGRIVSNADVYDFELTKEDMEAIDGLDQGNDGAIDWNPTRVE